MGSLADHEPVKLIIGLLARPEFLEKALDVLSEKIGRIDYKSSIIDFNTTRYYEPEMGPGLKRCFIGFAGFIGPEKLPDIKLKTNDIESDFFTFQNRRVVNIDPGYLSLSKFVLATTKDHQHRIYLDKGIFAEVTLRYRDKSFRPWEWTYIDYCKQEYINIFNHLRNEFLKKGR